MEVVWLGLIFVFLSVFVWTSVTIFKVTGQSENKLDMTKAINQVAIVNTILVLVLAGFGYFYVASNESMRQAYTMFMLHVNLLLSITAISVSSLYTVSN
jgi:hypothetical protein